MHQYIDRETAAVVTEKLIADRTVNTIYSSVREKSSFLFDLLTSSRTSGLLGFLNYDNPLAARRSHLDRIIASLNIDLDECLVNGTPLNTPRKLFERKIRYWETRPMPPAVEVAVAPADSRVLVGSFADGSLLQLKEKFFHYEELVGPDKRGWIEAFRDGDFAVFRLTPDKYHYNHVPVTGEVIDFYEIDGQYHSCNPSAVISLVTPYSKNKRTVTVIDTDIRGGSNLGLVMMVEVVALMIGDIQQCYSVSRYDEPVELQVGLLLQRGCPKSLFRPGSSVNVLIFQKERVDFCPDLVQNQLRQDVTSRYTSNFQKPLVETDVRVRSAIAVKKGRACAATS